MELFEDVKNDDFELVIQSITEGVDPDIMDAEGRTPLFYAKSRRMVSILTLSGGADPNAIDSYGKTPIFYSNDYSVVEALLKNGADPNFVDASGRTPIFYIQDLDILKLLLEYGADINARERDSGNTLLSQKVKFYDEKDDDYYTIKFLLDAGADPNVQNRMGNSALHLAVIFNEDINLIKLLLDNGANPNLQNNEGYTPLYFGVESEGTERFSPELVEMLIEYGAAPLIADKKGVRPIDYMMKSDVKSIRKLAKSFLQQTPLPEKHTRWQEYCSYLDENLKLSELRQIARDLKIPNFSKLRKSEICQLLARSFESFQSMSSDTVKNDIPCANDSTLLGDEFTKINPDYFIQDENGYCLTLLEIKKIIDENANHPYTRRPLNEIKVKDGDAYLLDVYNQRQNLLQDLENQDLLEDVHTLYDKGEIKRFRASKLLNDLVERINRNELVESSETKYATPDLFNKLNEKNQLEEYLDELLNEIEKGEIRVNVKPLRFRGEKITFNKFVKRLADLLDRTKEEDESNLESVKFLILEMVKDYIE